MKSRAGFLGRCLLLIGLVPTLLVGCHRWEIVSIGPGGVIEGEPSKVRITETGTSEQRELSEPLIRGDSIFARELSDGMSLARVQRIEKRAFDGSRTARNAVVTAVPIIVLMIALSSSMEDFDLGQAWRN